MEFSGFSVCVCGLLVRVYVTAAAEWRRRCFIACLQEECGVPQTVCMQMLSALACYSQAVQSLGVAVPVGHCCLGRPGSAHLK